MEPMELCSKAHPFAKGTSLKTCLPASSLVPLQTFGFLHLFGFPLLTAVETGASSNFCMLYGSHTVSLPLTRACTSLLVPPVTCFSSPWFPRCLSSCTAYRTGWGMSSTFVQHTSQPFCCDKELGSLRSGFPPCFKTVRPAKGPSPPLSLQFSETQAFS